MTNVIRLLLISVLVQYVVCGMNLFTALSNMKKTLDGTTATMYVDSYMDCLRQCMRRRVCAFVAYSEKYQGCVMDYSAGISKPFTPVEPDESCKSYTDLMSTYPQVLSGACADHTCAFNTTCEPLSDGGYQCTTKLAKRPLEM